jgi:2-dehydro-3-deoxyphosphogluconate aldolase / (4S)-4-hydroxy-2-oxoglutarate aldolase
MTKTEVCDRIREIGILPAIRVSSSDDAIYAAESVAKCGIPIVEITLTTPDALQVIAQLVKRHPKMIVGAGTVLDAELARQSAGAGAHFLTSPGLNLAVVEFAKKNEIAVLPGALTPTEVTAAWQAGSDLVKIFPCSLVGGDAYIKALRAPFPQVPLIAAGGVNQQTAANFILAGATAIGVGSELIPKEAIARHQNKRIHELAVRFLGFVKEARERLDQAKQAAAARKQ